MVHTHTHTHTHTHKPVYEQEDVTVLWNHAVHTGREITTNRPDIIIKKKKREYMHTDRCGNPRMQKCCAKGSGKGAKVQDFMYRDTMNAEPEMCDYTSNNCSHRNSNKRRKEKFERPTRKIFNRFTTKR
jgi:hypothetical protein